MVYVSLCHSLQTLANEKPENCSFSTKMCTRVRNKQRINNVTPFFCSQRFEKNAPKRGVDKIVWKLRKARLVLIITKGFWVEKQCERKFSQVASRFQIVR